MESPSLPQYSHAEQASRAAREERARAASRAVASDLVGTVLDAALSAKLEEGSSLTEDALAAILDSRLLFVRDRDGDNLKVSFRVASFTLPRVSATRAAAAAATLAVEARVEATLSDDGDGSDRQSETVMFDLSFPAMVGSKHDAMRTANLATVEVRRGYKFLHISLHFFLSFF